ncbi:MAG: DUF5403 family protein [Jatrophihabitantaceae bacterium]
MAEVYEGLGEWLATSPDIDFDSALDEVADQVQGVAVGLAAGHVDTGEFMASIHIEVDRASPSGRDRLIVSDHPASVPIEYGHVAPDGSRVPGLHVFARAADAVT